ncbi:Xaa-Pro dipeptidase [Aminobacter niigataensis]|uniref:Xaa-Pro dipeptidase n=1 Tax=Aminobacter niigataensis TaxID=83265 RepID=A0ABR6L3W6_9HYPH|nr:Xaa-Pro peptidase family protein [Aminobacter niigataensis]MBB4651499.1 Xaa-Pro dipeptidase [Aminobacter niigataensis]
MTKTVQISTEEFAGRLAEIRRHMRASKVDVALFDEIEAMTWICGYANSMNRWRCVIVPIESDPFILIRALDAEPCRQGTWIRDVYPYRDWEDPMPVLASLLAERGLSSAAMGLDYNSYGMSYYRLERLKSVLPGLRTVDLGQLANDLRLIKLPAEIELLRRASSIADEAMRRAAAACVVGGSQRDAARVATAAYVELGSDLATHTLICPAIGADFIHGHFTDGPLSRGDVIHLELMPRVSGYSARLMRCVSVGEPSAKLAATAEKLIAIQDEQIAALRPGALASKVDGILREGVVRSGLRDSYDNITGYTLGHYLTQTPRSSDFTRTFHPGADWVVEEGMVFHIYASADQVSMSETVAVGSNGPELLTQFPRRLIVNEA